MIAWPLLTCILAAARLAGAAMCGEYALLACEAPLLPCCRRSVDPCCERTVCCNVTTSECMFGRCVTRGSSEADAYRMQQEYYAAAGGAAPGAEPSATVDDQGFQGPQQQPLSIEAVLLWVGTALGLAAAVLVGCQYCMLEWPASLVMQERLAAWVLAAAADHHQAGAWAAGGRGTGTQGAPSVAGEREAEERQQQRGHAAARRRRLMSGSPPSQPFGGAALDGTSVSIAGTGEGEAPWAAEGSAHRHPAARLPEPLHPGPMSRPPDWDDERPMGLPGAISSPNMGPSVPQYPSAGRPSAGADNLAGGPP
jgi:hypothetical protein